MAHRLLCRRVSPYFFHVYDEALPKIPLHAQKPALVSARVRVRVRVSVLACAYLCLCLYVCVSVCLCLRVRLRV